MISHIYIIHISKLLNSFDAISYLYLHKHKSRCLIDRYCMVYFLIDAHALLPIFQINKFIFFAEGYCQKTVANDTFYVNTFISRVLH